MYIVHVHVTYVWLHVHVCIYIVCVACIILGLNFFPKCTETMVKVLDSTSGTMFSGCHADWYAYILCSHVVYIYIITVLCDKNIHTACSIT